MKTLYMTAGHGGNDPGAVSQFGREADEARRFVTSVARRLHQMGVMTYTDQDRWTLREVIAWLGTKLKSSDTCIDIHFNAGPLTATGVEVFIPERYTKKEFDIAKGLANVLHTSLNLRLRSGKLGNGVKTETESQHPRIGILSDNRLASANNILVEICFITNRNDMDSYRQNYDRLVENFAKFIKENI